jgi:DNA recombination protein RmuC
MVLMEPAFVAALVLLGAAAGAMLAGVVAVTLLRRFPPPPDPSHAAVRSEVRDEINRLGQLVHQIGQRNAEQFGQVDAALRVHAELTQNLSSNTQQLREALANPKSRGQWGERMAEDILRQAGFVEHVNYRKQSAIEGGRTIPDYTFLLPRGHVLYMDVKFPLNSYVRYLEAGSDTERSTHRANFLRDVRQRVRELSGREYARNSTAPAVDYVLLFLPNETVHAFIHEHDPALVDDALSQRVVLCSPLTLFAFLGVIRQAFDNFVIEQTSDEILSLLGAFSQQWNNYTDAMETVKRRLDSAQKAFDELTGPRKRQLERPLVAIENLRQDRGLPVEGELFRAG